MLLASAPFTASLAQTAAVSEKTFDWIFFAIVGIPFVLGLVQLASPAWLEPIIQGTRGSAAAPVSPLAERR
jgi:hypothetical protein